MAPTVILAKAGIQFFRSPAWMPACAGMTNWVALVAAYGAHVHLAHISPNLASPEGEGLSTVPERDINSKPAKRNWRASLGRPRIDDLHLDAGRAIPFIFAQAVGHVDFRSRRAGKIFAGSEGNGADHALALAEAKPRTGGKELALADFEPASHEQRLGVADAKRLQGFELAHQGKPDVGQAQRRVDLEQRQQVVRSKPLAGDSFEGPGERLDLFRLDR